MRELRFGLVGTGYWARIAHAPALASTEGIDFAAVWGRDAGAADGLAARYGATAYREIDAFLAGVDAVAFAVPPDVQSPLAQRAASAGKHLLLEKPVALSVAEADALAKAVEGARVASVVFFTSLFQADVRAWLADVSARGGWAGGLAVWLGSALRDASPFNTAWRRENGGLWDLGPHLVAILRSSLGPVSSVTADAGPGDVSHLVLHHQSGATSTITVTLGASEAAEYLDLRLWGAAGLSVAPCEASQPLVPLRTALLELAANARSGQAGHPCDVRFGREVVQILAGAQQQRDALPRPDDERVRRPPGTVR
jgi:predicted dehydrogenase